MKDLVKIILKKEDIKCSVKGGQDTRISNTTKTQRALWNHQNNNGNNNNNNNNNNDNNNNICLWTQTVVGCEKICNPTLDTL